MLVFLKNNFNDLKDNLFECFLKELTFFITYNNETFKPRRRKHN